MPKIAFFLPSLAGGGAERIVLILAKGFVDNGFYVDIVLAHKKGEYIAQVPQDVQIIDLRASRMFTSIPKLSAYLNEEKPDILLSSIEMANIVAYLSLIMTKLKPKWIFQQVGYPDAVSNKNIFINRIMKILLKKALNHSDHIITVSKQLKKNIHDCFNIRDEKISAIYNPALPDMNIVNTCNSVNIKWFDENKKVIISLGRLHPIKDYETLINAFNIVIREIPDSRLLILGEGDEREKIASTIQELGLTNYVLLPGFVNNPFAYLKKSNVFVMSSIHEGLPTVLIEAMACGVPIVSTDCPTGPREILDDGKYGYLVPMKDPKTMADAIIKVLNGNPKPISKEWLNQFDPQRIIKKYIQVIENLI